ncbi:hypothetical protein BJV78DRAFT_1278087 [Lactifluus subvellereus]|nr:hypothetical protein BJV78DRAFT_1278087 [Lactifluus subvellereus]
MTKWEDCPANNGISPVSLEARDEDYDTYLFWPSLNSGKESFKKPFVATHHRHLSPLFDSVDYYAGWDTAPSSPLSLAPPSDFRFPSPLGDHALDNSSPRVRGNSVQERDPLPTYSNMFRMGLFLTRAARHVDRAVQNVGVKLRKAKTTRRTIERTYAFDR